MMKPELRLWGLLLAGALSWAAGAEEVSSDEMPMRAEPSPPRTETRPAFSVNPSECSEMQAWDLGTAMCAPFPMGMPMRHLMVHGNMFLVGIVEQGPRGRSQIASPNMIMADVGTTIGDSHYLNLDFMGTAERWTFPSRGYPLLLQIGEEDESGRPYLDAQHPHNSPIMGLTLSDTIRLGSGKDRLKLFFAPRGESTEGPIAFMHRVTGMVNPDAPLGHHIGQDVGHLSSTVFGASLKWGATWIELSTFHGEEPEPTRVDLPIGTPDSFAARIGRELSPKVMVLASGAHVNRPEPNQPDIRFNNRYSASLHVREIPVCGWTFYSTTIFGLVTKYDRADRLVSLGEEFLFYGEAPRVWGRIEAVQRTPAELQISAPDPNRGRWVAAFTLGYSHRLFKGEDWELDIGGSITKNLIPMELSGAYGGNPWTGKVFLQLGGMKMYPL